MIKAKYITIFGIFAFAMMSCSTANVLYQTNSNYVYDPNAIPGEQQIASHDWRDDTIYFLLIDRFANGNQNNDSRLPGGIDHGPTEGQWNGGDFQGLIEQLDYIKNMGFTAIWITPPVENQIWDYSIPMGGYHGYWASCFTNVDPHYGTMDEYKAFVRKAHSMGIRVIQDIVCNHTGNYFKMDAVNGNLTLNSNSIPLFPVEPVLSNSIAYYIANSSGGAGILDFYHWTPDITEWGNWVQLTNYQASSLDDINSENLLVLDQLKEWFNYWVSNVGIDGVRMDTAKNVPTDFWKDFCYSTDLSNPGMRAYANLFGKTNFIMFGEVWTPGAANEDELAGGFTQDASHNPVMYSVTYYPMYSAIRSVFAQGRPTSTIATLFVNLTNYYREDVRDQLVTFIDNHDTQRFIAASDLTRTKLALVFIYTVPGIPCVYYGTEQAFDEQRPAMFADGYHGSQADVDAFDPNSTMYLMLKSLNGMRRTYDALRYGDIEVTYSDPVSAGILSFRRTYNGQNIIVMFNSSSSTIYANGVETGYSTATNLVNILSRNGSEILKTASDGKIYQTVSPYTVKVYIVQGQYQEYR